MKAACFLIAATLLTTPPATPISVKHSLSRPEAEALVDRLYARFRAGERAPVGWADDTADDAVYSAWIRSLIERYRQLAAARGIADPGTVDPFCQCRDHRDFAVIERQLRPGMYSYHAEIRFRSQDREQNVQLHLSPSSEGGRVGNVFGEAMPEGLAAHIQRRIRSIEQAHGEGRQLP